MLSELFHSPGESLAPLVEKARTVARLQRLLDEVLDPEVCTHVAAGALERGTLTLVADSPAWATRLRYLAPVVREQLSQRLDSPLVAVRIVARPERVERPAPPPRRAKLSRSSADMLASVAETIDDAALSRSLMRIARRGRD